MVIDKKSLTNQNFFQKNQYRRGFEYYNTRMEMHAMYPNDNDYFNQLYRQHFEQSFSSINFLKKYEPIENLEEAGVVIKELPELQDKNRKTIVFDLDETLIHCVDNYDQESDATVQITIPDGETYGAEISIRPFAIEILQELSKDFEIIIFTASHECYASKVIELLDPEKKYISHQLYRENCLALDNDMNLKDLRVLKNRNLKNLILVDNAAYSFGNQLENGIPIIPYYENKNDQELRFLKDFLKQQILPLQDVRPFLSEYFKLHICGDVDGCEKALEAIYGIPYIENLGNQENSQNSEDQVNQVEKIEEIQINQESSQDCLTNKEKQEIKQNQENQVFSRSQSDQISQISQEQSDICDDLYIQQKQQQKQESQQDFQQQIENQQQVFYEQDVAGNI
ncbi:HAD-like domain [Pseudocohnilembus persalinus]|uniref:Mitochondrial import inner membrane translocase subunit TIM50 n=1 Tax=Pseudocohnilembus persalinus TaxID=266149 RepID=A0A0V0QLI9_PSEPJ|nr:HAD-like domain [Pseudocohnilembus persalinus]|eukprot:KRX03187.1 HAD-like domain [Pseudocohnilembus persalinus]